MLDLSYFQNSGNVNTQTFTNAGTWVTWQKPRGAKFVNILCIGSGGGGAGGISGSVTNTRGTGGAGGGAGGIVRAQFQASILPDILYVYTGLGGSGSLGSTTTTFNSASNGERSFVSLIPDTASIANIVVTSGAVSARGAFSSVATTGETIATSANAIFLNLGTFIAVAGTLGSAGGANIAGSSIVPTQITTGGTGGAGNNTAGGFTAAGIYTVDAGVATTSGATGGNGTNGYILYKPVLAFRGGKAGGGSTNTGGNGGNGAYGCGGGGGGGGSLQGGTGGNGGDGLVIITTSF